MSDKDMQHSVEIAYQETAIATHLTKSFPEGTQVAFTFPQDADLPELHNKLLALHENLHFMETGPSFMEGLIDVMDTYVKAEKTREELVRTIKIGIGLLLLSTELDETGH